MLTTCLILTRGVAPLLEAAVASRPAPWQRVHRPADPRWPEPTARFLEYVAARVA